MSHQTTFDPSNQQTVQVIGIGRRLLAFLIDSIILAVGFICVLTVAGPFVPENPDTILWINLLIQGVNLLLGAAYFVLFWAFMSGQTPGKMALGIKIISTNGSPLTIGQAVLRYVGYIVSSIPGELGFIWAAFDGKRQGWHDKIAGTYVVPKETSFSDTDVITLTPSDSTQTAVIIVLLLLIGPVLITFLLFVVLILFSSTSGVAPFIYTLF